MRKMSNVAPRTMLRVLLLSGIAPVALYPAISHAQTVSTATAAPNAQLGEVTVTAARRTENLQKVSQAVTVVSGTKIATQGLTNISEIVADLPSVQATAQPDGFSIDIRGLGGDLPAGSAEGDVAFETDGIYNITSLATTVGFFDVSTIEVLPGPQSTRYGPNADGGVVNVITNDPVIGSKKGNFTLTVGNYGLVRAELAQNIPLTDVLALRIAGAGISRSSYFTPATSNDVGQSGRIKLLYKPSDRLTLKLSYEIDHVGGTGPGYETNGGPPQVFDQVAPYNGGSVNNRSNPWAGDYSTNGVSDANSQAHLYQNLAIANLNYRLTDQVEADELAGFGDIVGSVYDCRDDDGPGTIPDPHTCDIEHPFAPYHQYSSETRVHNTPGTPINWNLGFYHYSYTDSSYGALGTLAGTQGFTRTTTNAIFGEATFPVTNRFRLILGLRESFDTRERNFGFNGTQGTPDFTDNLHHFDYRVGAEYDLTPRSMEYVTVSTGYRPGGIGSYSGSPGAYTDQLFPNEVVTDFEVGSKNRFLDNTLQLNGDFFYYIESGYQNIDHYNGITFPLNGQTATCGTIPDAATGVVNGALYAQCQTPVLSLSAHEMGLETQARWNVTPSDQIGNSLTLLDATFDKNQKSCATLGLGVLPAGVCADAYNGTTSQSTVVEYFNLNGDQEPHSPHAQDTVSYRHIFSLDSGNLDVGGEAFITTGYYTHPVEIPASYQSSYVMGNVSVVYTPLAGNWTLTGFVNNVNNYAVKEATFPATTIGDPRTFGGTFQYHW